jgi:hypothetical protein
MIHGHSLEIADIDGDGSLDIFTAEMAKWTESRTDPDNPKATAWIFYGDGWMDILDKPYNGAAPRVDVWLQVRSAPVRR